MSSLFSRDVPTSVPDLIESFSQLVLDTSVKSETLQTFQDMITTELERRSTADDDSNADESQNTDLDNNNNNIISLESLVSYIPQIFPPSKFAELYLTNELEDMFTGGKKNKYVWLAHQKIPYKFGGRTYQSQNITHFNGVVRLMEEINSCYQLELDSCLIIRYFAGDTLSLHQDDESILDSSHPIVVAPLGCSRTIEFWDSKSESTGELITQATPKEGDILIMQPGCQEKLWHRVVKCDDTEMKGTRYALSFRKLSVRHNPMEAFGPCQLTSTPVNKSVVALKSGFLVHASRAVGSPLQATQSDVTFLPTELTSVPPLTLPDVDAPEHIPDPDRVTSLSPPPPPPPPPPLPTPPPPATHSHSTSEIHQSTLSSPENSNGSSGNHPPPPLHKHLVIGDSLVNGLYLPGSIKIYKGGIRPGELLQLLPAFTDILHPRDYDHIRTVTVIVGTNAINVKHPGKGMPLMDVVCDYEKLIKNAKALFPNARIGLYNILPRAHTCLETVHRIQTFNDLFSNHVAPRMQNVFWIEQYWEFLDRGSIRDDLYGRLGIHLKLKGKNMMAKCILNFQKAYN